MYKVVQLPFLLLTLFFIGNNTLAQVAIDPGDPPNPDHLPEFYGSTLSDIEEEVNHIEKGEVKVVATSPGGYPVYAVCYGEKG